jgi:hypothetical protein
MRVPEASKVDRLFRRVVREEVRAVIPAVRRCFRNVDATARWPLAGSRLWCLNRELLGLRAALRIRKQTGQRRRLRDPHSLCAFGHRDSGSRRNARRSGSRTHVPVMSTHSHRSRPHPDCPSRRCSMCRRRYTSSTTFLFRADCTACRAETAPRARSSYSRPPCPSRSWAQTWAAVPRPMNIRQPPSRSSRTQPKETSFSFSCLLSKIENGRIAASDHCIGSTSPPSLRADRTWGRAMSGERLHPRIE